MQACEDCATSWECDRASTLRVHNELFTYTSNALAVGKHPMYALSQIRFATRTSRMAAPDEIGLDFLGDSTSVGYSTTSGYKSINATSRRVQVEPT
jgi:hypothetical protein